MQLQQVAPKVLSAAPNAPKKEQNISTNIITRDPKLELNLIIHQLVPNEVVIARLIEP
jgi:hypothetical protein